MTWKTAATDDFKAWFLELSKSDQARVLRAVERIELGGPTLGRKLVDTVYGSTYANMKELRVIVPPLRIFFAFDPKQVAVLLIGDTKSGSSDRFYKTMIRRADALFAAHLKCLKD